jgi:hypothetical protein
VSTHHKLSCYWSLYWNNSKFFIADLLCWSLEHLFPSSTLLFFCWNGQQVHNLVSCKKKGLWKMSHNSQPNPSLPASTCPNTHTHKPTNPPTNLPKQLSFFHGSKLVKDLKSHQTHHRKRNNKCPSCLDSQFQGTHEIWPILKKMPFMFGNIGKYSKSSEVTNN